MAQKNYRVLLLGLVSISISTSAEVVDVATSGFLARNEVIINAPPETVYTALLQVGSWWDPEHTYSGDAKNMSIVAKAGGCFCEVMKDGGSIQHLEVIYLQPGVTLRMAGGLGPLQQDGVAGSLTWDMVADAAGTKLTQTYSVGGYRQGGFVEIAPLVDQVLNTQVQRLQRFIETGTP